MCIMISEEASAVSCGFQTYLNVGVDNYELRGQHVAQGSIRPLSQPVMTAGMHVKILLIA